jgi:hypothetical protein
MIASSLIPAAAHIAESSQATISHWFRHKIGGCCGRLKGVCQYDMLEKWRKSKVKVKVIRARQKTMFSSAS